MLGQGQPAAGEVVECSKHEQHKVDHFVEHMIEEKDISTWPWEHFANPCPTSQKGNVQACVPSLLIMIPLSCGGSG